jgi:DNA-binding transcriptional LysR family regulator
MEWSERIGRRIKLRDLHILTEVVQSGSMAKAAKSLAVSTPVVSKTIADLEHAVGVRLLDRSARGIEATMYGRALLRWSLAAFDDLRQGVKEIEFLADPTAGELRRLYRSHDGRTPSGHPESSAPPPPASHIRGDASF